MTRGLTRRMTRRIRGGKTRRVRGGKTRRVRDYDRAIATDESGIAVTVASVLSVGIRGYSVTTTVATRVTIVDIILVYAY
jgi:hypothetical protein